MRTAARLTAILIAAASTASGAAGAPPTAKSASSYGSDGRIQPVTRARLIRTLEEEFSTADRNADGFLTEPELAGAEIRKIKQQEASARANFASQFSRLDTNRDDRLSIAEFMAATRVQPALASDVSGDFAEFDRNKDGKVTFAEYQSVMLARFDSLDRGHKGAIVQPGGRMLARGEFMKNIRATFGRIDRGGDGRFTKAELQSFKLRLQQESAATARTQIESEFAKLDSNRDGRLSRTEFMAAAPAMPASPTAQASLRNSTGTATGGSAWRSFSRRFSATSTRSTAIMTAC